MNAYLIPFGGLLLLAGRLGDLIGRKRMFLAGSRCSRSRRVLCGLAQSQEMLIAARFVQGVGGAMASAVILGMIVTMFPEQREQAKAIGVYSFVAAAGASIGLLAGGVLTEAISWNWIFFVNVPIGVAPRLLAVRLVTGDEGIGLDEGRRRPRRGARHRCADARRLHDRRGRRLRLGLGAHARARRGLAGAARRLRRPAGAPPAPAAAAADLPLAQRDAARTSSRS